MQASLPASAGPVHHNRLLAALPAADLALLMNALECVPMRLGERLYEAGQPVLHAYFPTTAAVSLHHITTSGASAECSGVGREGVVGVTLFLGGQTSTGSAVVHAAGHGYRIAGGRLLQAFNQLGPLRALLLRYTQALVVQIAQTAACNRHHSVQQQLCRWLLSVSDRMPAGELVMTQELLAGLLGVRRESVTEAAGHLQAAGHIRYRRGHISIVDRAGLERCTCECFGVVQKELERLLPLPAVAAP